MATGSALRPISPFEGERLLNSAIILIRSFCVSAPLSACRADIFRARIASPWSSVNGLAVFADATRTFLVSIIWQRMSMRSLLNDRLVLKRYLSLRLIGRD